MLFTWAIMASMTAVVSACNFWGASFRRIASVDERHWFMLSAEPRLISYAASSFGHPHLTEFSKVLLDLAQVIGVWF